MLFDNYERYKTDTDHHIIKKQSNKKEKNMKKKGTKIIVNFLIRGIIGFAIIFFVNEFAKVFWAASVAIALRFIPADHFFDIRILWISWGCSTLRYNFLSNYVNIAQRLKTFKKGIDKYKSSSI